MEIAAIKQRLEERGFQGSYMAVYRFVRWLGPKQPDVTVRVEAKPGEEAQVDFGYAGLCSTNRPCTPQHKGKVEQGGVHYVKRNFLDGREPTTFSGESRVV